MQANDNDFQKFDRLKKEIEFNVDNGFSYIAAFREIKEMQNKKRRTSSLIQKSNMQVNSELTSEKVVDDPDMKSSIVIDSPATFF